jgi:uncharacterized protein (TIGR03437 family)
VQAPSDTALGTVNVVADNNGALSPPAQAQLQAAAPAFFGYLGNAIVSHWPDFTLVGNPASPAKPGDILVLWGTGFGATSPPFPAGIVVSGISAVMPLPAVICRRRAIAGRSDDFRRGSMKIAAVLQWIPRAKLC